MLRVRAFATVSFLAALLVTNAMGNDQPGHAGQQQSIRTSSQADADSFTVAPAIAAPGQFLQFNWNFSDADSLVVTPSLLPDEEETLPLSARNYIQVAPWSNTEYLAQTARAGVASPLRTASLSIVPLSLTASSTAISAGQSTTLTYSGPNNGSSYFLTTLPENVTVSLVPDSCSGATCEGRYVTPALGSSRTFMIGATGPFQGQADSPAVEVSVKGGMQLSCTVSPVTPSAGQPVTVAWKAANAASVTIDQGIGNVSPVAGSMIVHPTQSTNYTCTARDRFGDQVSSVAKVVFSTGNVSNLNHIVYMLQENRSFDSYFGNLAYYRVYIDNIPGAQMSDVNDLHNLPPGFTLQNPQGQSYPPFHQRTECTEGLNPKWNQSHTDMDLVGGDWLHLSASSQFLMDKFLITTDPDQYDPTETRALGYYDWTDLPFYYELATQFDTSDTFYSPVPADTPINRAYLFAASSYGNVFVPPANDFMWSRATIFRRLNAAGLTWRYYYQDDSVYLAQWADWNNPQIQANVRNIQEWYNILSSPQADQQLPQVVFIERASATGFDEHPGNNIQKGAARVQQILTPLLTSSAWPDSAFLLSYDEGSGLYEQQAPILVNPPDDWPPKPGVPGFFTRGLFNVTGFRLPVMIVSPWSKAHFVFHQQTDYTSFLKLIETRFSLTPLSRRDATAADLTDPNAGPFDFNTPEMLQVPPLPTQPTNGSCNYELEGYPQ